MPQPPRSSGSDHNKSHIGPLKGEEKKSKNSLLQSNQNVRIQNMLSTVRSRITTFYCSYFSHEPFFYYNLFAAIHEFTVQCCNKSIAAAAGRTPHPGITNNRGILCGRSYLSAIFSRIQIRPNPSAWPN
ncbi:hypothetical protein XELAEV_18002450mg [Xenopus laevis]|uniref:Uncharacterized protein n=1 Tax=Xenopus laevis TaxID=8355 RepID=A0A974BPL0_XENLA|nr:hypothetical protein XELAEV_18002450mg [Xenopus laevis]